MTIRVNFNCRLAVNSYRQNYSGTLTIRGNQPQSKAITMRFLLLYPYDREMAELAFYYDRIQCLPFGEALCRKDVTGTHPKTGKPIMVFEFQESDHHKFALLHAFTTILYELVNTTTEEKERKSSDVLPVPATYVFANAFQVDFSEMPNLAHFLVEALENKKEI